MFGRRRSQPGKRKAQQAQAPAPAPAPADDVAVVMTIDDDSFFERTEGGYTVVDFWAAWCAPCRAFAPVFAAVAAAHSGPVRFGSCDVEANPQTAGLLQITGIPTLVVFGPDGSELGRSTGLVTRGDLEATVARLSTR